MADDQTYKDEDGRIVHRTESPHIVCVEGLRGGRPVIEGTGYEVQHIVGYYYRAGMSVEQIVAEWDFLSLSAIFCALAYYHDHKEEIDQVRYESRYDYLQSQQVAVDA